MDEETSIQFSREEILDTLNKLNKIYDKISYDDDVPPCIVTSIHSWVIDIIGELESRLAGTEKISDGYHTFDELYYHRMVLFSIICNQNKNRAWKSWLHSDRTMFEDYFIVGITTPEGDYTYHCHREYWDKFNIIELKNAPEWDGHKPEDIERLYSLL